MADRVAAETMQAEHAAALAASTVLEAQVADLQAELGARLAVHTRAR
jgi:hypothetical protein